MNTKNQYLLANNLNKRIYGLDILRTLAIIQVLFAHTMDYIPRSLVPFLTIYDGVTVFFCLSGFLIGGILIKKIDKGTFSKSDLKQFWINRWFRTLPLYYFILILYVILSLIVGNIDFVKYESIKYFFFLQNLAWPISYSFIESWSLSVEEWFYIFTPIFLYCLMKVFKMRSSKAMLYTILFFLIGGIIIRFVKCYLLGVIYLPSDQFNLLFRTQVITRIDSIVYGVLAAYFAFYHPNFFNKNKYIFLLFSFLVYIISFWFMPSWLTDFKLLSYIKFTVFDFSLWGITVMLLLPFFNNIKVGKGMLYNWISFISIVSYSLYLTHRQIIFFIIKPLEHYWNNNFISLALIWILTFICSVITYKYIEQPFMQLRQKFNKVEN